MTLQVRTARRGNAKPLIGLYSESGNGKTYTALLLARGFAGPSGRICMIETEAGRGESYADPNEYPEIGGYDVIPIRDNFSAENYGKAISIVEKGGYDVMIVDSASHEWEGAGGVLDQAAQREADGKKGLLVWQKPKIDHQKHFMLRFMQTPTPLVILNMRAKYPMIEVYNEKKGKKEPQRSEVLEPKQSDDILYEMFVHGWIDKEHRFHPTKVTAKSLRDVFKDGEPITLETGRKLAEWSKGASVSSSAPAATAPASVSPMQALAKEISAQIKAQSDAQTLRDLVGFEYKSDLEKIKGESATAHDYIMNLYNSKLAELEQ